LKISQKKPIASQAGQDKQQFSIHPYNLFSFFYTWCDKKYMPILPIPGLLSVFLWNVFKKNPTGSTAIVQFFQEYLKTVFFDGFCGFLIIFSFP